MRVQFNRLVNRVRPKDHMGVLLPVFPPRHSPLQPNGNGIQSVYRTELPPSFAEVLAGLNGAEAQSRIGSVAVGGPMQGTMTWTGGNIGSKR